MGGGWWEGVGGWVGGWVLAWTGGNGNWPGDPEGPEEQETFCVLVLLVLVVLVLVVFVADSSRDEEVCEAEAALPGEAGRKRNSYEAANNRG